MKFNYYKKFKINKLRAFLFLIIIFLFSTGVKNVNLEEELNNPNLNQTQSVYYNYHLVSKGETIWSIVDNYNYKDNKKHFVKEVLELNNFNSNIKPGDLIVIPIHEN